MQNRRLGIIGVMVGIGVIFTVSLLYTYPVLQAFGGVALNSADAAKSIQVRMTQVGTNTEYVYNSFSRIGFVEGAGNFLLESVPSKDKNSFYYLVKKSLESKGSQNRAAQLNISMDIFSGDGKIIETLLYSHCSVTEYFVHVVDSKGTILFLKDDGSVEIREVTKFECVSFTIDLTKTDSAFKMLNDPNITRSDKFEEVTVGANFSRPLTSVDEGALLFNSNTNTLQKYVNGTWVDISSKGGPHTP